MQLKAVRGMQDLWGQDLERWAHVERGVRKTLQDFGYCEIRTPVLEKKEVFSQTVGDDTDIVEKQMYEVSDRTSGDDAKADTLVLRPEGTAAFIRSIIEHQLHRIEHPQRYYYYLPMFRHERPQKGRLRQFHQFGAELILDSSPEADAESIALLDHVFRGTGLNEFELRLNSVGSAESRKAYRVALQSYFAPFEKQLCESCQKKLSRAPMRILDCKNESCKDVAKKAPTIHGSLTSEDRIHHERVKAVLTQLAVSFVEDPHIVRGLDYYCKTAFEFSSELLGAQSALGGGGRYDGLSERFGEKPFPAVGWALGMERLMIALEAKGLSVQSENPVFYFAPLGQKALEFLLPVAHHLKRKGVTSVLMYDSDRKLKSHLKHADRTQSRFTLILGDDELVKGLAVLKDMKTSTQTDLSLKNLEEELLRRTN